MRAPHPFPARMAPDLALTSVAGPEPGPVLDPMCGSGMVLKAALQAGTPAIGFDLDPLAVLMSRVWTTRLPEDLRGAAAAAVEEAQLLRRPSLAWLDDDEETLNFVDFWFGPSQQHDLRKLAAVLHDRSDSATREALRLALSRTIVAKSRGASLASDVSHSRPHRTRVVNDYDVFAGFQHAAAAIERSLASSPTELEASVEVGDARKLVDVPDNSIGLVVTSPPYLNAIDYLRGHRLALVWLGHRIGDLRGLRSASVGAERALEANFPRSQFDVLLGGLRLDGYDSRLAGMLERYIVDLAQVMSEAHRVLRPGGRAVFVVGNSTIRGRFVDNATFAVATAERQGLRLLDRSERDLPPSRRYLPPPSHRGSDEHLAKRMRTEAVIRLEKPASSESVVPVQTVQSAPVPS